MEALALSFLMISVLFAVERFYFKEKRGAFTIIFCVFLFQSFLLGITTLVLSGSLGFVPSASLGGFALLTIGVTPVFAAVCAIFWLMIKIGQRVFSDGKQM